MLTWEQTSTFAFRPIHIIIHHHNPPYQCHLDDLKKITKRIGLNVVEKGEIKWWEYKNGTVGEEGIEKLIQLEWFLFYSWSYFLSNT